MINGRENVLEFALGLFHKRVSHVVANQNSECKECKFRKHKSSIFNSNPFEVETKIRNDVVEFC